jgi:uncharacterized membrane protein
MSVAKKLKEKQALKPNLKLIKNLPYRRFEFLDFFRGFEVVIMLIFHFTYDLKLFHYEVADKIPNLYWRIIPHTSLIFFFALGYSLNLSNQYLKPKSWHMKKATTLLGFAMLITLSTYFLKKFNQNFSNNSLILFGALHGLSCTYFLLYFWSQIHPTKNKVRNSIFVGLVMIVVGFWLSTKTFSGVGNWLIGFNIRDVNFASSDYFPILPWGGFSFLGYGLSLKRFSNPEDLKNYNPKTINNKIWKTVVFLGRHSLFIYLIHQPIFFAIFSLIQSV